MPTGVPTAARSVTPGPGRSSFDHPREIEITTQAHSVHAHPGGRSSTREVLGTFLDALGHAGHTATVPDLYAMGFRSVPALEEGGHCCGVKFPLTFASLPSPVTFAR